jgi:hypothetical protein
MTTTTTEINSGLNLLDGFMRNNYAGLFVICQMLLIINSVNSAILRAAVLEGKNLQAS